MVHQHKMPSPLSLSSLLLLLAVGSSNGVLLVSLASF